MDSINDKIAEYESHLQDAEREIENAMQSVCDICGTGMNEVHKDLYAALGLVRDRLRAAYNLYDNPELKIVK